MSQINIPKGWELKRLEGMIELIMGQAPPGDSYNTNENGTLLVKVGEFGEKYPERKIWTTKPIKHAKTGDVLLCVVGATIGKINLGIDCSIGRSVAALRSDKSNIIQQYLYYFLKKEMQNIRKSQQGSAQGVITKNDIFDLEIPLPSIEIQKKIIQKLDHIFAQFEEKTKIILELQKTKSRQSELLSDNFMSFLIADLIPTENYPSTWESKTLDKTFEAVKDKWAPNSKPENLNYIGLENIESNTGKLVNFTPTDSSKIKSTKTYFTNNHVLYGKLRPYLNKTLLPNFNGICSTDILVLQPKDNISREFLAYFLRSSHVLSKMVKLMYGTKMPRIKIQDLQDINIGLPPKKEQQQIVKKLQDSEKIVNTVKQSVNKIIKQQVELTKYLQHLQSSILDKAFSGKLVN